MNSLANAYATAYMEMFNSNINMQEKVFNKLEQMYSGGVVNFYGPIGSGKIHYIMDYAIRNNRSYDVARNACEVKDVDIMIIDVVHAKFEDYLYDLLPGKLLVFCTNEPVRGIENIEIKFDEYSGHLLI